MYHIGTERIDNTRTDVLLIFIQKGRTSLSRLMFAPKSYVIKGWCFLSIIACYSLCFSCVREVHVAPLQVLVSNRNTILFFLFKLLCTCFTPGKEKNEITKKLYVENCFKVQLRTIAELI